MLERARRRIMTRPFKKPPLRGLLHAHFVQASFIPMNIELEHRRNGSTHAGEAFESGGVLDQETINRIAHTATVGSYEQRARRQALTGEWLIYADHGGDKFYLAVAGHYEGDQVIYDRMMDRCGESFRRVLVAATSRGG